MTSTIDSKKKQDNYREQFRRLNSARRSGFNLEAIFISYAILSDRCEAILRYEGNSLKPRRNGKTPNLKELLNRIRKLSEEEGTLLSKYIKSDLVDRADAWKEERNKLTHALLNQELTSEELKESADEGYRIARKMADAGRNYKQAIERKTGVKIEEAE